MKKKDSKIKGIRLLITLIAFLAIISSLHVVSASQPAYMWITGSEGDIEGSVSESGREGAIKVYDMEHEAKVPTDERGRPTGRLVNGPLKIVKEYDKASPMLEQALITGEHLSVELKFFRTTSTGAEEHYYTIKLEDALIVSIKPLSSYGSSSDKRFEEVSLSYHKITWTWEPEGIASVVRSGTTPTTSESPFSITIEPEEAKVDPGDSIKYKMRVDAHQGFEDPIDLTLEVKSLVYSKKHDLGTIYPPYPKEFEYTVEVPSNIPIGVTGEGVLKAVSGEHVQEKKVTLSIKGSMPGFEALSAVVGLITALVMIKRSR